MQQNIHCEQIVYMHVWLSILLSDGSNDKFRS